MKIISLNAVLTNAPVGLLPKMGGAGDVLPFDVNVNLDMGNGRPDPQPESSSAQKLEGDELHKAVLKEITTLPEARFAFEATPACFAKGTLVHTKEGLVPIEKLKVGDWVLSKPEDGTGEVAYKRVTQTFAHGPTEVLNLEYMYPEQKRLGRYSELTTTANHPFWIVDQGWTDAIELNTWPGEESRLLLADGREMVSVTRRSIFQTSTPNVGWTSGIGDVTDVLGGEWDFEKECIHQPNVYAEDSIQDPEDRMPSPLLRIPVYNIEVEDFHTYFVGIEGVWVHNKNLSTAIKVQNDAYFSHPRRLKYHMGTTALATISSSAYG